MAAALTLAPNAETVTVEEAASSEQGFLMKQQEIDQMLSLAAKHGYVCQATDILIAELATSIGARMIQRLGANVYQMGAYSLPSFPKELAEKLFPEECVIFQDSTTTTWKLATPSQVNCLGSLLNRSGYVCAGSTKAFRAQSQPVIRVVARLLQDIEISHVVLQDGRPRLYVNFPYVLATEDGEIHWPKDSKRREIAYSEEEEAELREELFADLLQLAELGHPLSPGFCRLLGREEKQSR